MNKWLEIEIFFINNILLTREVQEILQSLLIIRDSRTKFGVYASRRDVKQ